MAIITNTKRTSKLKGTSDDDLILGYGVTRNPDSSVTEDASKRMSESISGLWGADSIYGGAGNDSIDGDTGADFLSGGSGNDKLNGGLDNDALYGDAGDDRLSGEYGDDLLSGGDGADTLEGSSGQDTLSGGSGNDKLNGGLDNDALYGDAGNDLLSGEYGDDLLWGGDGADTLEGSQGDDVLYGGSGKDRLSGGVGRDVFRFSSVSDSTATQMDVITDFDKGGDKIDLSSFAQLHWTADRATYGVWYKSTAHTRGLVYADTDGDGQADLTIEVKGQPFSSLSASDFIFPPTPVTVNENTPGAAIQSLGLNGLESGFSFTVDDERFEVASGQLKLKQGIALDHETADTLNVTVTGYKAGGIALERVFAINVTDVAETTAIIGTAETDTIDHVDGLDDFIISGLAGDDSITTGQGNDIVRPGEGADTVNTGAGDDIIVIVGQTVEDQYAQSDISNPGGSGIDLSGVITLADLNGRTVSEVVAGESIDGGAGTNTLAIYGDVDLTGVTLTNITQLQVNSTVNISAQDLKKFIEASLKKSYGNGESVLNITNAGGSPIAVDLSGINLEHFKTLNIASGVTVVIDQADVNDLSFISGDGALRASNASGALNLAGKYTSLSIQDHEGNNDATHGGGIYVAGELRIGYPGPENLSGGSGNDHLRGEGGEDAIYGFGGQDILYGGADDDTLYGGADKDTLDGGAGRDTLWGGDGGDTFRFTSAAYANDFIMDFNSTEDAIDLSQIVIYPIGNFSYSNAEFDHSGISRLKFELEGKLGNGESLNGYFSGSSWPDFSIAIDNVTQAEFDRNATDILFGGKAIYWATRDLQATGGGNHHFLWFDGDFSDVASGVDGIDLVTFSGGRKGIVVGGSKHESGEMYGYTSSSDFTDPSSDLAKTLASDKEAINEFLTGEMSGLTWENMEFRSIPIPAGMTVDQLASILLTMTNNYMSEVNEANGMQLTYDLGGADWEYWLYGEGSDSGNCASWLYSLLKYANAPLDENFGDFSAVDWGENHLIDNYFQEGTGLVFKNDDGEIEASPLSIAVNAGANFGDILYDADAFDRRIEGTRSTIAYELAGSDSDLFAIDAATGVVTFAFDPVFYSGVDNIDNTYDLTIRATDIYFSDVSGEISISVTVTPASTASPTGQPVIDLGEYGKLINPVHVDEKWYYVWDMNGDGAQNSNRDVTGKWFMDGAVINAGGSGYQFDRPNHFLLDGLFTQDSDGNTNPGSVTDNTYRYATLSGVRVALPTVGNGDELISTFHFSNGTAIDNDPSGDVNPGYNDLLAIWDAFNGSGTEVDVDGTPPGWEAFIYWSATPTIHENPYVTTYEHARVGLHNGYVWANHGTSALVALEVIGVPSSGIDGMDGYGDGGYVAGVRG